MSETSELLDQVGDSQDGASQDRKPHDAEIQDSATQDNATQDNATQDNATQPLRIRVATAQPYDVIVGRYLRAELLDAVGSGAVAIVHQPTMVESAESLRTVLEHLGSQAYRIEV